MKKNIDNNNSTKNLTLKTSWLVGGIVLLFFSIGVIIFATTNAYCRGGEAICASKRWGAYIGVSLGLLAITLSFLEVRLINTLKAKTRGHKKGCGLIYFGLVLVIISTILAIIGFNSKSLNSSGVAVSPGFAMTMAAAPVAIAGAIIFGFGLYASKKGETSNFAIHPILTSIYIIGLIAMVFLIFF